MPEALTAEPIAAPKSFFNSPDFDADLQKALDSQNRASADAPAVVPPVTEKTDKTAEATATATSPADDTPADIQSDAGKSSWKKLKDSKAAVEKERDEWRTKHDSTTSTLNAKIVELEKAARTPAQQSKLEDSPEYQQLKVLAEARAKELEQYSEHIRLLDVQEHPKFKAYFKQKTDAQFGVAKEIGGDKLVEILQLPAGEFRKEKLNEIVGELDPLAQAQLGSVLVRLREIDAERNSEIASATQNYQTIQAQQKEQTEKQRAAVESAFQSVAQEVASAEKGLPVFQERAGDTEWNRGVQERLALAQATFAGNLKPEDAARQAHWAAAAPVLLQELNTVLGQKAALEKQITELRGLAPNPGGAKAGDDTVQLQSEKKGMDGYMEKIVQGLG